MWVHIVCNNLSKYYYRKFHKDNTTWLCVDCVKKEMPFSNLSDNRLKIFMSGKIFIATNVVKENQNDQLDPQELGPAIKNNLYTAQGIDDTEISKESHNLFIHMNIASITYHIDELHSFIIELKCKPNIIGISECGLVKIKSPLTNIDLPNFCFELTSAEYRKGGMMIYIQNLRYKLRKDLNIYKPKAIELTFIEVINDKRLNTIIGCIYKHPKTTVNEFTNDFMVPPLEKLSLEKKEIMLMGDFNVNLLTLI